MLQTKTRDVVALLGCTESHLSSLIRRGRIARPAKDASGDYVWSEDDVAAARRALAEGLRRCRGMSPRA